MRIITLLTDFGNDDEYVGVMKGVILTIAPEVRIIDITHRIAPQDILSAAMMIPAYFSYFPDHAIHLAVVDPGVGSRRSIIAVQTEKCCFIAPNNGVLTQIIENEKLVSIFKLDRKEYFLNPVSSTFHGRDVFAPAAAWLAAGTALELIGSGIGIEDVVRLSIPKPVLKDDKTLVGSIVSIDRFGNLTTNIRREDLDRLTDGKRKSDISVYIDKNELTRLSKTYMDVGGNTPLALIGSRDYLEIAVNGGSAKDWFKSRPGDAVVVQTKTK